MAAVVGRAAAVGEAALLRPFEHQQADNIAVRRCRLCARESNRYVTLPLQYSTHQKCVAIIVVGPKECLNAAGDATLVLERHARRSVKVSVNVTMLFE